MTGSKNLGRGIHLVVLVEESANILGQLSILGIAGGIERSGGLSVGIAAEKRFGLRIVSIRLRQDGRQASIQALCEW